MALAAVACGQEHPEGTDLRVATWDVGGIRTADLSGADNPRLKRIAEVIQRIRPNILLINRIAYDTPGGLGVKDGEAPGQNGQRFADLYLAIPQAEGLAPLKYKAFMAPVNSGMASGLDFDGNGKVVTAYPSSGVPGVEAAAYSGDCWGPGAYPGEHGMALLVDERLTIVVDGVRTFRLMPWEYMPASLLPRSEDPGGLSEAAIRVFRLATASHWDVPVRLPDGSLLRVLCGQPGATLGKFADERRTRRWHDEVRFWADYAEGEGYLVDDKSVGGGADLDAPFVLLGNLGARNTQVGSEQLGGAGSKGPDPISDILFVADRINPKITPTADLAVQDLEPTDTRWGGGRTDFVLPSLELGVAAAGVWRHPPDGPDRTFPTEHFPVWMVIRVMAPVKVP